MVNIGVIGSGYWGPNLIRNFITCPESELTWACDLDEKRLKQVLAPYPGVKETTDMDEILSDDEIQGVAIATPVHTHYPIAMACLERNKHVLIEKPMASSAEQGEKILELAERKNLQVMCDHTFCYTGAVRKIKEIVKSGDLGDLYYFDSIRVNLGLFQQDINVVWDLAPHDLSIEDFIVEEKPVLVSAHGVSHAGNSIENIAYISLNYQSSFISHFHVNWLSPVKIRMTMIAGSEKMLVWNDMDFAEKIKIYDKGIDVKKDDREEKKRLLVSYRTGDMHSPHIEQHEALALVVKEFIDCIKEGRPAITDGKAGLRVLRILDAADRSIKADGANVRIEYP